MYSRYNFWYSSVNFVPEGTWDGTGFAQCCTKKINKNTVISTYPELVEITGIPYMKKVTEFRENPRKFTELYDTEFGGIPRNFSQFRTEYGIDESKKNRRNSVSTEFRGHPSLRWLSERRDIMTWVSDFTEASKNWILNFE